jgi:hypothetical protein
MKKAKNKKPAKAQVSLNLMTVPENKRVLSKPLQEGFIHFLHHHPADRLRKNLRRMMIDYLMHESARESVYIYDTLLDLDGLFELLDVAAEEWK